MHLEFQIWNNRLPDLFTVLQQLRTEKTGVRFSYAMSHKAALKKEEGRTFAYVFNLEVPICNKS